CVSASLAIRRRSTASTQPTVRSMWASCQMPCTGAASECVVDVSRPYMEVPRGRGYEVEQHPVVVLGWGDGDHIAFLGRHPRHIAVVQLSPILRVFTGLI